MSRFVLAAVAVAAIVAWPVAGRFHMGAAARAASAAPIPHDYVERDRLIAFYERNVTRDPDDQITLRMLAAQYLQRFRERGDLGDVARAQRAAQRSLVLQPAGNDAGDMTLSSALLAYHEFDKALKYARDAAAAVPSNDAARAQIASLLMELGKYDSAQTALSRPSSGVTDPSWTAARARYFELTGRLSLARNLVDEAATDVDRQLTAPAYARSWYHVRAAQLAFEAGDDSDVREQLTQALTLFPDNASALMLEAQWERAHHDWAASLQAATRSAQLYPLPQALGYQADAQRALGDERGAEQTDALIDAERHLYNVQGVNDRLLAMYYAQRHAHLDDALRMARADLTKRGDEIYADDTMAWVLAAIGRYGDAYVYAERATRLQIEDAMVQYHAGAIAMETGHDSEARDRLTRALHINPNFDAFYAADARARLATLSR